MRLVRSLFAFLIAAAASVALAAQTLVPAGSIWKYLDNGSNQGTAWRSSAFDDSTWRAGPAQLGYGDGDEATVIGFGPNANAKFVTTYFRHAFTVGDKSAFTGLTLRLKRDDGAVVYLNGQEVFRSNLPAGEITHTTLASNAADDGNDFQQASIALAALNQGANLLAVEVHQTSGSSSDLSFDLELVAETPATARVTRGPYLQLGTPTGTVVRFRTDSAVVGRVRYGASATSLDRFVDGAASTTEHVIDITGLAPNTKYFYSVGTAAGVIAGADANHFFVTAPAAGTPKQTRIWVLGDAGTKGASQRAVRDAFRTFTGARGADLLLMLGDNAYENGTDSEYQAAVFDMYPDTLRQTVLWPTIGNHDTAQSSNPPATLPYYQMFTLPQNAEAGGLASGTKDYYSFDYGNIHFICLDSMTSDRSPSGPMLTWLRNDLAANTKPWIIAFWHHPPYSKGSHDSDAAGSIESQMRANALPILEAGGVDLVLSGHSHAYERSFLIDNHYGVSTTFSAVNKKNGGDGRPEGQGAYSKSTLIPAVHEGAVYVVAGSSGQTSGGSLDHPAMFLSLDNLGSLVLDVDGSRLDARFLRETGAVADSFTIIKGGGATNKPPVIALTSPVVGATFTAPASVALGVNAADPDGTVSKVEYFAGASLIATSNSSPFAASWANVAAGSYSITARATDDRGASATSPAVSITVNPAPGGTAPSAPSGLTASPASSSRINLAWADNSSNETSFVIERSTDGGVTFSVRATVDANVRTFSDTGLARSTRYHYRVRSANAAGSSAPSNVANARTRLL